MSKNTLSSRDIVDIISIRADYRDTLTELAGQLNPDAKGKELMELFATVIVQDLYDPHSTDEANCNRISGGLISASDQLVTLALRVRHLAGQPQ